MKETKSLDIRQIVAIVFKRKWLIIVPLILVSGFAYGATFFLTPEYQSSTIIWIDRPHTVSRELVTLIGDGVKHSQSRDQRRQLQSLQNELTSQAYLTQLIQDLRLDRNPELNRQAAKMREQNPDRSTEELKLRILLEQLKDQVDVGYVGADQIKISVQSTDAVQARDMVQKLAQILEEERTRYEMDKILDNQSFADLQLQRTEYQYNLALDSLTAARSRLTRMALPQDISSPSNLREIQTDIDEAGQEIQDSRRELTEVKSRLDELGIASARMQYADTLVDLRGDLENDVLALTSMMEKYAWTEQSIINYNIRIRDNQRLLEREVGRIVAQQFASYPANQQQLLKQYFTVQERIDVLTSLERRLQSAYRGLEDRINMLPKIATEIDELERRVTDARRYRDAFRSEESTVEILSERAKDRTQYRVIEPAQIPLAPFYPNKAKIIMMGFMLGLVIGGAAVFLAEIMDNSFKRVDDVEEALGLPVLATIPKIERLRVRR